MKILKKIFTKAVLKKTNSLNEAIKNLKNRITNLFYVMEKINRYNYRWRYKKAIFKKKFKLK